MLARPSDPSLNWWSNAPRPAPAPSSAQELTTDRPTFSCAHPSSSASCSSSQPSMRDQPSLASLEDSLNSVTQNKAKLPDHTPSIPPPGDAHSPLLLNLRDLLRTHARDQDDKTLSNATNNSCVVPQTLSNPINAHSHRSSSDARYDPGDLSTQPHAAASARTDIWDQGKPSSSAGQSSNRSQPNEVQKTSIPPHLSQTSTAGPGALPTPNPSSPTSPLVNAGVEGQVQDKQLKFHFAPNMKPLLAPPLESLPVGSDAWAFAKGYISVTPIRAQFAGPVDEGYGFGSEEAERKAPGAMW
ncbi:hypothetical protein I316_01321 [Kwoniella heveanensis BCC8398]|uniref:Uncharacterized protein n=1 Tax=Kwoniella heveanensis BCC8398 TaxID=1296120 RepID=A0A1B9H0D7_9TREE|nr:hypothetical protein I316_01321 [Kwoniella heveanensis BCC8398]